MEVRGIAGSDSTRPGIDEGIDEGIDGGGVALQSKGSSGLSGEPGRGDQIATERDHGGSES